MDFFGKFRAVRPFAQSLDLRGGFRLNIFFVGNSRTSASVSPGTILARPRPRLPELCLRVRQTLRADSPGLLLARLSFGIPVNGHFHERVLVSVDLLRSGAAIFGHSLYVYLENSSFLTFYPFYNCRIPSPPMVPERKIYFIDVRLSGKERWNIELKGILFSCCFQTSVLFEIDVRLCR